MFFVRSLALSLIAGAACLASTGSATAGFEITVKLTGVNLGAGVGAAVLVTDGSALDSDPTAGIISFSKVIGKGATAYTLTTTATSNFNSMTGAFELSQASSITNKSKGGTLTVTAQDDTYYLPVGATNPVHVTSSSNIGAEKTPFLNTNDFRSIVDGDGTGLDNPLANSLNPVTSVSNDITVVAGPTTYTVFNESVIHLPVGKAVTAVGGSTEGLPTATPAPAGLLLAATAVPLLSTSIR